MGRRRRRRRGLVMRKKGVSEGGGVAGSRIRPGFHLEEPVCWKIERMKSSSSQRGAGAFARRNTAKEFPLRSPPFDPRSLPPFSPSHRQASGPAGGHAHRPRQSSVVVADQPAGPDRPTSTDHGRDWAGRQRGRTPKIVGMWVPTSHARGDDIRGTCVGTA